MQKLTKEEHKESLEKYVNKLADVNELKRKDAEIKKLKKVQQSMQDKIEELTTILHIYTSKPKLINPRDAIFIWRDEKGNPITYKVPQKIVDHIENIDVYIEDVDGFGQVIFYKDFYEYSDDEMGIPHPYLSVIKKALHIAKAEGKLKIEKVDKVAKLKATIIEKVREKNPHKKDFGYLEKICEFLVRNEGWVFTRDIKKSVGISRQKVHYNLKILHENGLIENRKIENEMQWRLKSLDDV